jgi:riboflavin kinase/FMN adenylyltransferase
MRRLVTALEDLQPDRPACLAIGSFDGVHLGHQAILRNMIAHAHEAGMAAVVITFYPHPSVVLRGRRPSFYLSTPEDRNEQLLALGVDAVVNHPFNQEVASIRAADFVTRLLDLARLRELWCGEDFTLGHNREGTVTFLQAEGARRGFSVNVATPQLMDGEPVSSTRIRQTLRDGAVDQAARFLGRPFSLPGVVVDGDKPGRALGFPTAHLRLDEELAIPASGVYVCHARLASGVYPAVTSIEVRPTFETQENKLTIEAYLLDFSGDLYGHTLRLDFIARLRPELKFADVKAQRAQIEQDVEAAQRILKQL